MIQNVPIFVTEEAGADSVYGFKLALKKPLEISLERLLLGQRSL